MNEPHGSPEWSDDAFLGGQLTLRQHRAGHRAGTDAVLLAAAVPADAQGDAIDAGAASGAAGLMLAMRAPALHVTCVEIDPAECALARHNVATNGLEARCTVIAADLLANESERIAAGLQREHATIVISNPPFLDAETHRISPDAARARAHVLPPGGLDRWCRALAWLAAPDGFLALIHRADRLADLLAALEGRFGGLAIRPIAPRAGENATRVIITGFKGSRAPLSIRPALILHEPEGRLTPEAEALHKGHATSISA